MERLDILDLTKALARVYVERAILKGAGTLSLNSQLVGISAIVLAVEFQEPNNSLALISLQDMLQQQFQGQNYFQGRNLILNALEGQTAFDTPFSCFNKLFEHGPQLSTNVKQYLRDTIVLSMMCFDLIGMPGPVVFLGCIKFMFQQSMSDEDVLLLEVMGINGSVSEDVCQVVEVLSASLAQEN